jgi:hypothetical protein
MCCVIPRVVREPLFDVEILRRKNFVISPRYSADLGRHIIDKKYNAQYLVEGEVTWDNNFQPFSRVNIGPI